MQLRPITAAALGILAGLATVAPAQAGQDDWGWHRRHGRNGWHHWRGPRAYVPPPVFYVRPPPVFYAAPPPPPPYYYFYYGF